MNSEEALRQRIADQEIILLAQADLLEGQFKATLNSLKWSNILTQSVSALLHSQPLKQLFVSSALRFITFKVGKSLVQKLWQRWQADASASTH